jgi:hypothetical protein
MPLPIATRWVIVSEDLDATRAYFAGVGKIVVQERMRDEHLILPGRRHCGTRVPTWQRGTDWHTSVDDAGKTCFHTGHGTCSPPRAMRLSQRVDHWTAALAAALGVTLPDCASDRSNDIEVLMDAGLDTSSAAPDALAVETGNEPDATPAASDGAWPRCTNPRDIGTESGMITGYVQCDEGYVHRAEVRECPVTIDPDAGFPESGDASVHECYFNADCTARPYGRCVPPYGPGISTSYHCEYGCASDADCTVDQVCLCGALVGTCVPATCKTDADCAEGFCADYDTVCDYRAGMACQTSEDQCFSAAECGRACQLQGTYRACATAICGRPFLVHGAPRTGSVEARNDWVNGTRLADALDAAARAELATYYEQLALLEHASIAAFARFTLQLLALGAPPDLIDDSQRAALDEAEHARLCFSLASRYRGEPCGPGPIDVRGALNDLDAATTLVTTILEGCIGETVAALEAGEAAGYATDPFVKSVFETIQQDETRHSALAWRVVRWLIARDPQVSALALRTFQGELRRAEPSRHEPESGALKAHGYVCPGMRAKIRSAAVKHAIGPLVQALISPHPPAKTLLSTTA